MSSKIVPFISIFAGLLWFYAAFSTDERRSLSVSLGVVFVLVGLVQLAVNRHRPRD
ncbi:MAG TPA: hypothetical protein VF723_09150 [Pyrinomonadaceae bacterium]|jgi:hypothetical protein